MNEAQLLHDLVRISAIRTPEAAALTYANSTVSYASLWGQIRAFADGLVELEVQRGGRVAIFLEKRPEFVVACFGSSAAGAAFVPLNPLLKGEQISYIVQDCGVRLLVTSPERLRVIADALSSCATLDCVIVTEACDRPPNLPGRIRLVAYADVLAAKEQSRHRVIDTDLLAILYTSGSTGRPKGVVLCHRNMVIGAKSVADYLENEAGDSLLAALPLSFDAGFSQLTTAFHVGARVVLLNYLLPRDVVQAVEREKISGLTAVPPLYIQLSGQEWPASVHGHLRYFANTGGRMPKETLLTLRKKLPQAKPFLMYGLTEAFRSTYLPPEQVDRRPDSIGKAIPNAEILVLREDGSECEVDEPGELVHRGALVGLGYWGDAVKTAERFRSLPVVSPGRSAAFQLPEIAVFSGDTVRRDAEGFLYFIGRRDDMMKTSGYRVSPTEVEEVLYATRLIGECVAFGVEHFSLGHAIHVIATPPDGDTVLDIAKLIAECRKLMPAYMVPHGISCVNGPLPRNPNGKIDRKLLSSEWILNHRE